MGRPGQKLSPEAAERNRERARQWRIDNPEKSREKTRQWYALNKDRVRISSRQARYSAQPTRPEAQRCESCERLLDAAPHFDHDHATGQFRGWLCSQCNTGIGLLGDDVHGLEKAIAYLKRAANGV